MKVMRLSPLLWCRITIGGPDICCGPLIIGYSACGRSSNGTP